MLLQVANCICNWKITKQMVFVAGVGGEGNITCVLFETAKIVGVLMLPFLGFNFLIHSSD